MMFSQILKKLLKQCGYTIYRNSDLPFGWNLQQDINRISPDLKIKTIFDVGANKGQTTLKYRQMFNEADIYSFEPVKASFDQFQQNTKLLSQIFCFNLALGANNGQEEILVQGTSGSNSINNKSITGSLETVEIITLDNFILEREQTISQIDLLKIDTEGFELQVLEGAKSTLQDGKILYIFIEVTFRPEDTQHTQFIDIYHFLQKYNFNLIALYDCYPYWGGGNAIDYSNALFKRWEKGKNLQLWQ